MCSFALLHIAFVHMHIIAYANKMALRSHNVNHKPNVRIRRKSVLSGLTCTQLKPYRYTYTGTGKTECLITHGRYHLYWQLWRRPEIFSRRRSVNRATSWAYMRRVWTSLIFSLRVCNNNSIRNWYNKGRSL